MAKTAFENLAQWWKTLTGFGIGVTSVGISQLDPEDAIETPIEAVNVIAEDVVTNVQTVNEEIITAIEPITDALTGFLEGMGAGFEFMGTVIQYIPYILVGIGGLILVMIILKILGSIKSITKKNRSR